MSFAARVSLLAGTFALGLLFPFASGAQPVTVTRVKGGVALAGPLTSDAADRAIQMLGPQDTFWISSREGSEAAALHLADVLQRKNIPMRVNGECAGPCANYIFLLAPGRAALVGSSVRFTLASVFELKPQPEGAALAAEYRRMWRAAHIRGSFVDCLRRALTAAGAVHASSVAVSPGVLGEYDVAVDGKYEWTDDKSFRRDYAAEFDPSMLWLDDAKTCHATVAGGRDT
ncbi:hypothetical protein [Phenylobacterium sp.]|jgi:hypothetical protein|uniref:hypothetical protein n=1 Tax=Phenylobacterium sp. TaxID=1871053 RepID=UPI002E37CD54|nr:hypothetical protein [Phenylobacterium sp.]HEX4712729.1 hypothetical protein [Phenylobacterium sp.]